MAAAERNRLDEADARAVLFYEYFHGDNGAGIGASHQTGWTGLVGVLPLLFREMDPGRLLARGRGTSVPAPRGRQRARATA